MTDERRKELLAKYPVPWKRSSPDGAAVSLAPERGLSHLALYDFSPVPMGDVTDLADLMLEAFNERHEPEPQDAIPDELRDILRKGFHEDCLDAAKTLGRVFYWGTARVRLVAEIIFLVLRRGRT